MSLNETPSSERTHIAFFGTRNAGKSSVVNAVTGQQLAVVSEIKGTTTDPVRKSMELLPLGPVVIIDTPGMDDEGPLGEKRVQTARQVLEKTDVAVLVVDAVQGRTPWDDTLIELFEQRAIPYVTVLNKSDLLAAAPPEMAGALHVSALTGQGIDALKERIALLAAANVPQVRLVGDLIESSDFVVLVTPIDKAAPKGRLILPQQQTIRDILDSGAIAVVCQDHELEGTLARLGSPPKMVITDSQVFAKAAQVTPEEVPLTSFSILFARYKGLLTDAVKGVEALDALRDGSVVLICEGCTHHRQCDDIGTVKLPGWITKHTGKRLNFEFSSGGEFPEDLSGVDLIVHCGGCMLNEREMKSRQKRAMEQNIPMTNYGILIAHMQGILMRSLTVFPELQR